MISQNLISEPGALNVSTFADAGALINVAAIQESRTSMPVKAIQEMIKRRVDRMKEVEEVIRTHNIDATRPVISLAENGVVGADVDFYDGRFSIATDHGGKGATGYIESLAKILGYEPSMENDGMPDREDIIPSLIPEEGPTVTTFKALPKSPRITDKSGATWTLARSVMKFPTEGKANQLGISAIRLNK